MKYLKAKKFINKLSNYLKLVTIVLKAIFVFVKSFTQDILGYINHYYILETRHLGLKL